MSVQRSACQGPSFVLGQELIEQIGNAVGDQQIGSNGRAKSIAPVLKMNRAAAGSSVVTE